MAIETTCPKCQALFRLGDEMAGKKVKCQKCANVFVVVKPTPKTSAPIDMEIDDKPAEAPTVAEEEEATAVTEDEPTGKAAPPPTRKKQAAKSGPRHETPRDVGSSVGMTALLVVLVVGTLLSCVGCVVGLGWWYYAAKDKPTPVVEKKDDKAVQQDGDNKPVIKDKDGEKKGGGKELRTYTLNNLLANAHDEKRFDFVKGQRLLITVTNQLTRRDTDVDLFVFRGNNKNPLVWDDRLPNNVDQNCRVEFTVPADDSYRIRVLNLGPGTAMRCNVVIETK